MTDKISPTKYKMYNKPVEVKVFHTHGQRNQSERTGPRNGFNYTQDLIYDNGISNQRGF